MPRGLAPTCDARARARRGDEVDDVEADALGHVDAPRSRRCIATSVGASTKRLELDLVRRRARAAARASPTRPRGSGSRTRSAARKRSSCASGSGYVPSYSIGFWVARTRNGRVEPVGLAVDRHLPLLHRLEERGLRLRRRAVDLVGEQEVREDRARGGTRSRRARWSKIDEPVMSEGMRSGVNWMRAKLETDRPGRTSARRASSRGRGSPRSGRGRRRGGRGGRARARRACRPRPARPRRGSALRDV